MVEPLALIMTLCRWWYKIHLPCQLSSDVSFPLFIFGITRQAMTSSCKCHRNIDIYLTYVSIKVLPFVLNVVGCKFQNMLLLYENVFSDTQKYASWKMQWKYIILKIKANLRDFIAATGLVTLLKLDSNRRLFGAYDLQIQMTSQDNRAPVLCYIKLCALFQSHQWIQTGVTGRKRSILVKISAIILFHVNLKFDWRPWKTIGCLFYATSSLVCHFIAIGQHKLE